MLNGFQSMCANQVEVFETLEQNFRQELKTVSESEPLDLLGVCNAHMKWCQKSYRISVEYRYAHEYGDTSISKFPSFEESDEQGQELELMLTTVETPRIQAQVTSLASNRDPGCDVAGKSQDTRSKGQVSEAHLDRSGHDHPVVVASGAAAPAALQEHATTAAGSAKQSQTLQCSRLSPQAEPPPQINNDSKINRKQAESVKNPKFHDSGPSEESITEKVKAATLIQAVWRRYRFRVRLQADLEYAPNLYEQEEEGKEEGKEEEGKEEEGKGGGGGEEEEEEEEDEEEEEEEEEDESEYEEEIDLDSFIMADDDLISHWTVPDIPAFPLSFPDPRKTPLNFPVSKYENRSNSAENCSPVAYPQQAWNSPIASARSGQFSDAVHRPKSEEILRPSPPPPKLATSDRDSDILPALDSKRKDDICKEWGFKDARTAQLMFQRAKKMKLNAERREKVKKLDPHQRLALFRKLGQGPPLLPVKSPSRKMLPRKEYFQARQLSMDLHEGYFEKMDKEDEDKMKESRTYQWIHTQIAPVEQIDQRNQPSSAEKAVSQSRKKPQNTNQRISLFQRHQLSNAEGMTMMTMTTGSSDEFRSIMNTKNETMKESRRHSTPGPKKRPVHLPPIERSQVPTSLLSGSMSHWNPDVKRSGGWGSGKKRAKRKSSSNVAGAK